MNRNIDILGRLVIPKEMRKQLGINEGDPVHIELKGNQIIITKPVKKAAEERIEAAIKYITADYINGKVEGLSWLEVDKLLNILNGE